MFTAFNNFFESKKDYTTLLIRFGIAGVLLWFGIDELLHPELWIGFLPSWLLPLLPVNAEAFVLANGIVEILLGLLLLFGWKTRIVAAVAFLHLLAISLSVGYNDIMIRDLGLSAMALSLIFSGAGKLSVDERMLS